MCGLHTCTYTLTLLVACTRQHSDFVLTIIVMCVALVTVMRRQFILIITLLSVFILHLFTNHTYMWTNRSGMQQTMMDQEEILYYRKSY